MQYCGLSVCWGQLTNQLIIPTNRGIAPLVILAIVALLALGAGSAVYYVKLQASDNSGIVLGSEREKTGVASSTTASTTSEDSTKKIAPTVQTKTQSAPQVTKIIPTAIITTTTPSATTTNKVPAPAVTESQRVYLPAANIDKPGTIVWSKDRPLTWADFQGPVPDESVFGKAAIRTWYDYSYSISYVCDTGGTTTFTCSVRIEGFVGDAIMNTQTSWVRPGFEDAYRLVHEQTHFNIVEYYARKLEAGLAKLKGREETRSARTKTEAIKQARLALYAEVERVGTIFDEEGVAQIQYDQETEHSQNEEQQLLWNAKVNGWLGL